MCLWLRNYVIVFLWLRERVCDYVITLMCLWLRDYVNVFVITWTCLWLRERVCDYVNVFVITWMCLWLRDYVNVFVITWMCLWLRECVCDYVYVFVITCMWLWLRVCVCYYVYVTCIFFWLRVWMNLLPLCFGRPSVVMVEKCVNWKDTLDLTRVRRVGARPANKRRSTPASGEVNLGRNPAHKRIHPNSGTCVFWVSRS